MDLESAIKGLPIDLHNIELVKSDDVIKGKGTLSLNSEGIIELKIFPDYPKDFSIETFFESYNKSATDAGKLLSEEVYYSLKGIAVNNDQYICKRLLITDHDNLRVYTIKLCSDLFITNDPKLDSFQTARVQIPYKIKLPTNRGFEVEKKYSDKWISRSLLRNIFEINLEDTTIDVFSTSDTTNILIQNNDTVITEDNIRIIITTLEFITSSIIDRYSVEYEKAGIFKRVFRYSSPQRKVITKGKPPISIPVSVNQDNITTLFVKFYKFIKVNSPEPLNDLLIRVISAQNSFITTYALTITTAIESILHSYYSTGKKYYSDSEIAFVLTEIKQTEICDLIKKRLTGMVNSIFGQESADDIIKDLIKKGKVKSIFYDDWKKLRNPVSHGKDPTDDFQKYIKLCESNLVFFHILVFILIDYKGVYSDYSTYGYPHVVME